MARYTCKVSESGVSGLLWLITEDWLQPDELDNIYQASAWDPDDTYDPYTSSIALEMIGISETHNTSVECIAYYPNTKNILSDRVYLRVQGKCMLGI